MARLIANRIRITHGAQMQVLHQLHRLCLHQVHKRIAQKDGRGLDGQFTKTFLDAARMHPIMIQVLPNLNAPITAAALQEDTGAASRMRIAQKEMVDAIA